MDIVIDTSAIIAVIIGEPERETIIEATEHHVLLGPGSIPWEVGNAFSAMFKQHRLTMEEARKGIAIFEHIPLRLVDPDFSRVLQLSKNADIYAYDAYFLDCAVRFKSPLLTLDKKLKKAARALDIQTIKV